MQPPPEPQGTYGQAPPLAAHGQPPMAQYATGVPPQPMVSNGKWSTGLCDCGDDVSNCMLLIKLHLLNILYKQFKQDLFFLMFHILSNYRLHYVLVSMHYFRTNC